MNIRMFFLFSFNTAEKFTLPCRLNTRMTVIWLMLLSRQITLLCTSNMRQRQISRSDFQGFPGDILMKIQ